MSSSEVINENEYFQDPIYGDTYPMTECLLVDNKFKFYFKTLWDWFNDIKKFTNPITNLDFSKENIIIFVLKARVENREKVKLLDSLMEKFLQSPNKYFEMCNNPHLFLKPILNKYNNEYTNHNNNVNIPPEFQKELEEKYKKYKTRYMELDMKSKLGVILTKEKYEMNRILGKVNYDKFYNKLGLKL
jgi:hypothetical protein